MVKEDIRMPPKTASCKATRVISLDKAEDMEDIADNGEAQVENEQAERDRG